MFILKIDEIIVSLLICTALWYFKFQFWYTGLIWIPFMKYFKYSMVIQKEKFWLFSFIRLTKEYFSQKNFQGVLGCFLGLGGLCWYLKLSYLFLFLSPILDILRFFGWHYGKMLAMEDRLKRYYKDDDVKIIDNVNGILALNSKIPLTEADKSQLELVTNATIISITQDLKYKYKFHIKHETGVYNDYRHKEKISSDRLHLILKSYGDAKPLYVTTLHGEVNDKFEFITTIGKKRLIRLLKDIEHKLGCKKNTLSIEFDEEKAVFTHKHIIIKNYFIDDVIMDTPRPNDMMIPFIIGINKETGKPVIYDYKHIGHMICAGMTGCGKSSVLHGILYTLMFWNDDICFYMFDLKGSELPSAYGKFSNCKVFSINDGDNLNEAIQLILQGFIEIEKEYHNRQRLFSDCGVKDIDGYNRLHVEKMPYMLIVIDEANALFELVKKRLPNVFLEIEAIVDNLCARGRNAGMWQFHTMQQVTKENYSISWRRAAMTRIGMKLRELRQCQMIFENLQEIAEEEHNLFVGEYIVLDNKNQVLRLQNARVTDDLQDLTYQNLKEVYGDVGIVVEEKENAEITECGSENIS
jgi:hypothetical protein